MWRLSNTKPRWVFRMAPHPPYVVVVTAPSTLLGSSCKPSIPPPLPIIFHHHFTCLQSWWPNHALVCVVVAHGVGWAAGNRGRARGECDRGPAARTHRFLPQPHSGESRGKHWRHSSPTFNPNIPSPHSRGRGRARADRPLQWRSRLPEPTLAPSQSVRGSSPLKQL